MEKLLTLFSKIEGEWMALRGYTIQNLQIFAASQTSSTNQEHAAVVAMFLLPQGPGVNPDPRLAKNEEAYAVCAAANDNFDDLLEKMRDIVALGQDCVREVWSAEQRQHTPPELSAILERGRSGNVTSPVDAVHAMSLKLECYQSDSLLISSVLSGIYSNSETTTGAGDQDGDSLNAQIVLLSSASLLDTKIIQKVDYLLALSRQTSLLEKALSSG
mmetsp:Transcript_35064/g.69686  ORF Transcript_35064/g.69686 Transcript_35064/m.69686 type:complete len:216 (+) Transcript_35064:92-739(+)